ncbi:hypothetical protein Poli38472_006405 [Pythium oligandrum]|uniref:Alpha-1,3/1,6-mannosyltransferase ALG2 n=1 Tax=Pythium oligandrum TaxID=41045 RepID=A0A8K1C4Q1_PYTOL|nr:hypothetical protein Poli38472_006405 [Pythium oligandrum]|eukprot:TMW56395.1 hypothetical protein Poli38472_006405 [Pythium oligandrum]
MLVLTGLLLAVLTLVGIAYAFVAGLRCSTKRRDGKAPSSPLRVGFLHPDFGIGGAENLVVNAAIALQKKNVHVTVFTAHHDVSHCFEETRGDGPLAKCIRVHGDWLPRTILGKLYAFCAILRILYVTLVITFVYANEIDAFFVDQVSVSIPFLRFIGKPVLFYGHYPDKLLVIQSGSKLKHLYRLPLDTLEEVTTVCSDVIVVNSKFTRSVFEQAFPRVGRRELGILYPPVDVSVFEQYVPTKPRDPNLFVSLNRFERKKNVALAIHALARLKSLVPPETFALVRLIVAGGYDPNNVENIEHLKELQQEVTKYGLEKHVEFRTSVSDSMKKELLSTAQAIMYTPDKEHFGIVPVEAMTCGTPVIAVKSGGPLESILDGETGFLCEVNADAFADAMAKVCGKEKTDTVSAMGAKGKKRARDLFSLETFADSLYASVQRLFQ